MKKVLISILKYAREITRSLTRLKWKILGAKIGKRTVIHGSVYIGFPKNFKIGNNCALNKGCFISSMESITIGDNVHIAPYCSIFDSNHKMPITRGGNVKKSIKIGSGCWIGTHSIILKGVTIGKNVTIGAGSIVTKDIPDNSIALGSPAKIVGENPRN